MISMLKHWRGSPTWLHARNQLADDLTKLETAVNQQNSVSFTSNNTLLPGAIAGDPTPATRYVANTGVANGPKWDFVNIVNGIIGRLLFKNLTLATGAKKILGRGDTGGGDFQELDLGDGLDIVGQKLVPTALFSSVSTVFAILHDESSGDCMQNRPLRVGPVALTNTLTTNILNPAAAGAGVGYTPTPSYIILRHIRIVNKTAGPVSFSFWIGASAGNAAGTEFMGTATVVDANKAYDWGGQLRLDAADFLVGGASALTSLTFEAEGEVGLA